MGVDHGLQGKDNEKNKEKRAKRAVRDSKLIRTCLVQGKKKELVFDEAARTEWLSGFHKRKQQRRLYGLTMQVLKEKKAQRESRKERRNAFSNSSILPTPSEDLPQSSSSATEKSFNDDSTIAMFGGDVSVVIDTGIVEQLEGRNHPESFQHIKKKVVEPKKTNFEKAAIKAKGKMRHKAGRAGGKNRIKRSEKTQLLHKALGSGLLGPNQYKGNKKGGRMR